MIRALTSIRRVRPSQSRAAGRTGTTRAVLALVAALAAIGAGCDGSEPAADSAGTETLPAVVLERVEGGTFAVDAPGAKVLNLWATWCAPCRAELPAFDSVASLVAAQGHPVEIVGVNVGETGEAAAGLIAELGLSFDQVLDPRADIQRSLRITGMPATIFADPDGRVVAVHNGELSEPELVALLDTHLGIDLS